MKKSILIIIFILFHGALLAQEPEILKEEIRETWEKVSVTGRILEKGTKRFLGNQRYFIRKEGTKNIILSSQTDEKGEFSFRIEPGDYQFIVASPGYDKFEDVIHINAADSQVLVIRVTPQVINPYNIVIRKKKEKSQISEKTVTIQEAAGIPGNNRDVLQAMTNMPGVNSVSVFNGYGNGIVIRGSAQEDSLFLLADHGLNNLYHFGGLESIIEPEFIESIDYNAGGFSAEYGNTLGGVISMNVRDPRADRTGGYVNLSLLSSSFMVEGPVSDKDSLAVSMKRGFLDQYMKLAEKFESNKDDNGGFEQYPVYYDGSFIYHHNFAPNNNFRIIGIASDDRFKFKTDEDQVSERFSDTIQYSATGQNLIAAWDYNSGQYKNVLSSKFSLTEFSWKQGERAFHKQDVQEISMYEKLEYRVNQTHNLKSGLRLGFAKAKIDARSFVMEKEGEVDNGDVALEMELKKDFHFFYPSLYLMDQIRLRKFTITPGINWFNDPHNKQSAFDPRFFIKYHLTEKAAVKGATGLYSKRPLYDETVEPWGTKGLKPEKSIHVVAGAEYYFTNDFYLDIQIYYKKFSDMVVRIDAEDPTIYGNEGTGKSYGTEVLLRQNMTDNFFGWVSYSWSVAKRKDGKEKPERFFDSDITHNLIGVLSYKLNRYWSFGFKYQYSSGTPYTDLLNVDTNYDVDNDAYSPVYTGPINNDRLASHHQLDFRVDKYWLFNNYVLSTYLDIKNVFQQKHEVGVEYNEDYTDKEKILAVGSETPLIFLGLKADF